MKKISVQSKIVEKCEACYWFLKDGIYGICDHEEKIIGKNPVMFIHLPPLQIPAWCPMKDAE